MCGIVGLFIKNPAMEKELGEHLSNMLIEMTERGPDSAGIAMYDGGATDGTVRITVLSTDPDYSWEQFKKEVRAVFGESSKIEMNSNHAFLFLQPEARTCLLYHPPSPRALPNSLSPSSSLQHKHNTHTHHTHTHSHNPGQYH